MYLLTILITVFGYASQETIFERKQASAYIDISATPKIGEVFTVSYTFVPHMDAEEASYYPYVMKFSVNTYQEKNAYRIIKGQLENELLAIKKGEPTTYTISIMITKSVPVIQIGAGIPGHIAWTKFIRLYLIDPETGQYGTKEEYNKRLPLTWRYDPADGIWLEEGETGYAEWNMRIIATAKKLEPALSDSEALCLHADIVNETTPYQYSGPILPGKTSVTEEELFDFLIERGWLEKHRAGEAIKKEWLKQLSDENKRKVEELQEKEIWKK